jgi:hypothetical protein
MLRSGAFPRDCHQVAVHDTFKGVLIRVPYSFTAGQPGIISLPTASATLLPVLDAQLLAAAAARSPTGQR